MYDFLRLENIIYTVMDSIESDFRPLNPMYVQPKGAIHGH
jgi:hypothetical protein